MAKKTNGTPLQNAKKVIQDRRPAVESNMSVFRLKGGHTLLVRPKFMYKDENGGKVKVRYSDQFDSIFVDEQDDGGEPVKLERIPLSATNTLHDPLLRDYLLLHPDYGRKFYLVDKEGDAQRDLEKIDKFDSVWDEVRKLEDHQLRALTMMLIPSMAISEINKALPSRLRLMLREIASKNPEDVKDVLQDPILNTIYLYHMGVALDIIKFSPKREAVLWTDSGQELCKVPVNKDPGLHTARQLLTDEYLKAKELLESKLND